MERTSIVSLWFEGFLALDLSPEAPAEVVDILSYLTRPKDYTFEPTSDHEFFTISGWRNFLQIDPAHSSQAGLLWSDFRRAVRFTHKDVDHYRHTLSFRRLMHDDVEFYQLWWQFLYWLAPYVETGGFVGYYRETYSLHPHIVYLNNGKVFQVDVSGEPRGSFGEEWEGHSNTVIPPWLQSLE